MRIVALVLVWLNLSTIVEGQGDNAPDVKAILRRWHEAVESQSEYRARLTVRAKSTFGETVSEFYLYKSADIVVLHGTSQYDSVDGKAHRDNNFSETIVWNKDTVSFIDHTTKSATYERLIDVQKGAQDKSWWNWLRYVYRMRSSLDETVPFVLGVDPDAIGDSFDVTVVPLGPKIRGVGLKFEPNSEDVVGGMCGVILAYIPDGQLTPSYLKYFDRGDPCGPRLVRIELLAKEAYEFPNVDLGDLQKRGYAINRSTGDFADSDAPSNATVPTQPTE